MKVIVKTLIMMNFVSLVIEKKPMKEARVIIAFLMEKETMTMRYSYTEDSNDRLLVIYL